MPAYTLMLTCAGADNASMEEERQLTEVESVSSIGLRSNSLVEPDAEAASTRQQLLIALSLIKHLAHNSPTACEALAHAGVMDTVRRYGHSFAFA